MPIDWKKLKLKLGPPYEQQVSGIIQTFNDASREGERATVEYMCGEIAKEIDRLEEFIQDNDTDTRIVLFQKQCRRLRKVLQSKNSSPTKIAQDDDNNVSQNIDQINNTSMRNTNLRQNNEKTTYSQEDSNMIYDNMQQSMGQTADELALVDAAREEYASQTLERERRIPIPTRNAKKKAKRTRKASIYGWETKVNKGIAFPHANASEYQLQEGDSFSFQLVLNRRDYHQLMNRRRIKKLDSEVKLKKLINESKRQDIETAASRFGGVVTAEEDMNDIPFAFRKSPRRNSLSTGPYVEPSYKARSMYREFAKDKWVGDKKKGFRTF